MIKLYGRYGFPSDPIVDYSIRLIYIALNITWNNLQWRLYFFMSDWYYMCDFELECPFWYKWQENILCKIPSDSNTRNIIIYCEFSNAVLRHATRMLPGMNEKTKSYIFTSGSRRFGTLRPLEINMETEISYLINQGYWSCLGIFRNKIFSRKFVYGHDGGHRSKHVLASRS